MGIDFALVFFTYLVPLALLVLFVWGVVSIVSNLKSLVASVRGIEQMMREDRQRGKVSFRQEEQ